MFLILTQALCCPGTPAKVESMKNRFLSVACPSVVIFGHKPQVQRTFYTTAVAGDIIVLLPGASFPSSPSQGSLVTLARPLPLGGLGGLGLGPIPDNYPSLTTQDQWVRPRANPLKTKNWERH